MKKIHIIGLAAMLITTNTYALEMSVGSSQGQGIDKKTDLSNSKSKTINKNKTTNKSNTKTKEKSVQKSKELTKVEQTGSLVALRALEKSNIEPFKSCQVLSKAKLVDDFGLGCRTRNGWANTGLCNHIGNAAKANMPLKEVISDSEIFKLKQYATCVSLYGGLIAQDMINEKFSVSLKNDELVRTFKDFSDALDSYECRLAGSPDSIQCGSVLIKLGYEPSISYANISLYSPSQTFYGYSSRQMRNKSKRVANTFSLSKSKQKSLALNLSKTLNKSDSLNLSLKQDSSANLSLSKFIPGE